MPFGIRATTHIALYQYLGTSAEAAVCWGCRHGHRHMALASQLLVWEGRPPVHPTAAGWAGEQSPAPIAVVCFFNTPSSPATSCPPVKFPGHSDPISLMTSAILLSLAGYQTEVGIWISFCCLLSLCSHAGRRQGEEPCLLQQKKSSKMTIILVCINKALGCKPQKYNQGWQIPRQELIFWAEASSIKEKFLSLEKSLCAPLSLVRNGLSWKRKLYDRSENIKFHGLSQLF